ncbi:MAG TPA: ferrochelatase [Candidatus Latescibacteria bacterium]|jgi:ferrochelatase|nr:ferrochelatase [Gemmatimonadaceae bacterium]MDP6014736.1 ferrochelatase [Candidatus Latescibacterota bacterium]HJP29786.1 ferrochelatase [Candidatus Latescibacterota bacterium]
MPDSATPVGVLIAQLGTPEAPTPGALRTYLREFLTDRRVIDLNPLTWWPILYLFILTRRPARSARLYERIWTEAGSPLLVHSRAQQKGVQTRLGDGYRVIVGMRYGKPGIDAAMRQFADQGIDRVVVLPMFPQFSCSTTGSIYDAVTQAAFDRRRRMPTIRFVPPYFAHADYIDSLRVIIEEQLQAVGQVPDRFLITFHGIPRRYADEGDPYRDHCLRTGQLLAEALGLQPEQWVQGFQSRFGKEEWLQPYTEDLLAALPAEGVQTIMAACPGFTADCLETLDEIGHEGAATFREVGGAELHLAPCLNAHPRWLDAMASIIRSEACGWTDGDSR